MKRCCASCANKMIDDLGNRSCSLGYASCLSCRHWRMSDELRNCGTPFGVIKDKAYLQYVLNIRYREKIDDFSHRTEPRDIEEIRKEYLNRHKDIRTDF